MARLLEHLAAPPSGRLAISTPREVFGGDQPRALSTGPGWAYLRLGDGCEHKCAFCTIPRIRGRFRSRPWEDVLAEAQRLAAAGVRELNLVAQDLCSYGRDLKDGSGLEALLPKLAGIGTLSWIRSLYLSPDTLDNTLVEAMASTPKVLPYFDLPLQHIADPVLKAMGRRRSGRELRELLAGLRRRLPQAVLRTTLLVGHPGEGEAEFTELWGIRKGGRLRPPGLLRLSARGGHPQRPPDRAAGQIGDGPETPDHDRPEGGEQGSAQGHAGAGAGIVGAGTSSRKRAARPGAIGGSGPGGGR
ncbi:hypothetical protein DFAR_460001 [Desulfarculales bacterium]